MDKTNSKRQVKGTCSCEIFENTPKRYQNLVYGRVPNSFPPLRGTNSTTTNYIAGTAYLNSNKDNFRTPSPQGLLESVVINLYQTTLTAVILDLVP